MQSLNGDGYESHGAPVDSFSGEWADMPSAPGWARPVVEALDDPALSELHAVQLAAQLRFARGLCDFDAGREAFVAWLDPASGAPEWLRDCLRAFGLAPDVWAENRHLADIDLLIDVADDTASLDY